MVEIKRTRSGGSFVNKPIGVVNVRTGAEKVYEAKAKTAENVGRIALDLAKNMQVKEGVEYATEVLVEDENGLRGYQKVPSNLGSYGREEANRIYQKRYMDALQNDVRSFAQQLRSAETDPVRYEELFNDYVKQSLIDIDNSGGADVAAQVAPTLYNAGKLHVNDMQAKNIALKEKQSRASFREILNKSKADLSNLVGSERDDLYDYLVNDIRENAISVYGFSDSFVADELNNLKDNYAVSVFSEESANASPKMLAMLQDKDSWSNPEIAEKFKKTINFIQTLEPTRRNEFNAYVSRISSDRAAGLKNNIKQQTLRFGLATGNVVNDTESRKGFDGLLGYTGVYDALSANTTNPNAATIENNAPIVSQAFMDASKQAVSGFNNPNDFILFHERLVQMDAAERVKGRTIVQKFGNDAHARKVGMLLELGKGMSRMGRENMVMAYQQSFERDPKARLAFAADTADYDLTSSTTMREIANHYVSTKLSGLPMAAQQEAIPQVEYALSIGVTDVNDSIKNYVKTAYKPSEFYETSIIDDSYSAYINPPENYFDPDTLNVFRADLQNMTIGLEQKPMLMPIQSSDTNAQWMVYTPDNLGRPEYVMKDGLPLIIDSTKYQKAKRAYKFKSESEANFLRMQTLGSKEQSKKTLDTVLKGSMRIVD